jgi:asparagine synthase (glutamine-hydrolysing)
MPWIEQISMSTPFCIYSRKGRPIAIDEVDAALDAIAQQGPDGRGVWSSGVVGLGHLALAETPEMRFERQPAWLDSRIDSTIPQDIVISADVRLDNRAELASKLQISSELLPTLGDSQLLLAAYLRWGELCPSHLLGDFAFIIWDGPQRKLLCARDPLGVKPLYTQLRPDLFLAAGDIRALVAHPQGNHQPDLQALASYLRERQFIHPTQTYLSGVAALLPAHTLTVTADQAMLRRYWFPDQLDEIRVKSLDIAAEELRSLLADAVRVRLRRVQGVGAHMSGGLDSTAVAYLAARQLAAAGDTLSTYSWQPTPTDDTVLATAEYRQLHVAIQQENFDHTTVNIDRDDIVPEIVRDICLHHTHNYVYERLVRQAAATRDVRVLLSGWGGDELITAHGTGYLAEMFWRGKWGTVARNIQARSLPNGKNPLRHYLGTLYHHVVQPSLPDPIFARSSSESGDESSELPAYIVCALPDFAAQMAHRPARSRPRRRTRVRAYQLELFQYGHLHRRIESWAADGADVHMIYRYPLLDRRVVEFALGLPAEAFVQGQTGRYLFRRAMTNILPPEVCWGNAKLEPMRVSKWNELSKGALLPALNAIVERLSSPPRLEIDPLRRHITRGAIEPTYDMGDLGMIRRAIQVLGAGWQLPK